MIETNKSPSFRFMLNSSRLVWALFVLAGASVLCAEKIEGNRFEKAIEGFEAADAESMPPEGAIVAIGSSSMRFWGDMIEEDLSPLTIIPRGFGGSTFSDAIYFAKRIVTNYKPRAVLVYEGDNDIGNKMTPEAVRDDFVRFVGLLREELPEVRVYVISIKPSIARIEMWEAMVKANALMEAICSKDEQLIFIDAGSGMLGEDGKPLTTIFKADNLHMNRSGYEIWRDAIRPVLIEGELKHERE